MMAPDTHSIIPHDSPVIFIGGQTAAGKTDFSLQLAASMPCEIINADSRQIYSHMAIGTGWPDTHQIDAIPHHLLGFLHPTKTYSLGEFLIAARETISSIHGRGKVPLIVGGTGQYIWALAEGWDPPTVSPKPDIRRRLKGIIEERGVQQLHADLGKIDPEGARIIDPFNGRRIIRALEVWEATGIKFSEQRTRNVPSFSSIMMGVTTPDIQLRVNIDRRIERMLSNGWIEEVASLLEMGVPDDSAAFSSAGYRAIRSYLGGQITIEEMRVLISAATYRLARRQKGWFQQKDTRISWWDTTKRPRDISKWISHLPSLHPK